MISENQGHLISLSVGVSIVLLGGLRLLWSWCDVLTLGLGRHPLGSPANSNTCVNTVLTCMHRTDPLNHSQCTGQWRPFTCRVTGTTTVSRTFPVSRKETVYASHPDCFVSFFGLILVDPEEEHTGFPGVWPLDQHLIFRPRVRTSAKPPQA